MSDVWVCETGEYEQRYIFGIYATVEDAAALIKAEYAPPYVVAWGDLQRTGEDRAWLTGRFEAVPGFSTSHTADYDLTRMAVQTSEEPA